MSAADIMNVTSLTPQETRSKNLILIARLTILFSLVASALYIYLGITSKNWYNYLVAGAFLPVFVVAILIIHSGQTKRSKIGIWHLISSIILAALVISAVQASAGAEIGSALLVIILVLVIKTIPPEQAMRGAVIGAIASMACSVLAFYSPLPQIIASEAYLILTWVARGSTLAFLAVIMVQYRSLNLANKLLTAFLGIVVLISMTYNVTMSSMTTQTMTNQIGQDLHAVAASRSTLIGNLLSGQVENLKILALDDSIQNAIRTANTAYSGNEAKDLNNILALDQEWRTAVSENAHSFVIDWQLSNQVARDLQAYRSLYPDNVETFATDGKGALVGANNLTSDYYQADESWWQTAYNNGQGKTYISLPEYDESAKAISVLIAVPVFDKQKNEIIGILRTTLSLDKLFATVQQTGAFGKTGEVDIIFPANPTMRLHNLNFEEASPALLESLGELTTQAFARGTYQDIPSIYAKAKINTIGNVPEVNELNWTAVAHQDISEALEPVQQQVRTVGFFGNIMAGIAVLLSLVIAQRLAKPIVSLTETANDVARGNLDARANADSQDEIGQLSKTFNAMTSQLKETLLGLEARVVERTAELEESSRQLQKRAGQFEAIAELARTITSIQGLDLLLPRITQLVSQQFGFYHVGLFLLDESGQYAVLSAANSEGGQRMLARKHRLGVGQTGIVGFVTSTGDPRIALDTGIDPVYFDNPDLPETRSEIALPLRVGGSIIGALDVQSTESNAFSQEDVEVLTILADEVSIAIENARLFEESQRVLANAQTAVGEYALEAWQRMVKRQKVVGYELSGASIQSLEGPILLKESSARIPIKLRDRVVGSMSINMPEDQELNQDEIEITQALAHRVGIAIENATLLEESQRAAVKEQLIGEITGKIGSSVNLRNVLQTAVEELGRNIPGSEIVIELKNQQDKSQGLTSGEIK
jgi:GAF domain-containing protein/HAMP domain-containing protein